MRTRKDQSPAPLADPLQHRRLVAIVVGAVAIGALLVAELDGAKKDHAAPRVRKQPADRTLHPVEPHEAQRPLRPRAHPAVRNRIGDIG